jgi:hypothetical protein
MSHFKKETHLNKESHSPNTLIHEESHPPRRFQKFQKGQRKEKDFSSYQCYHCDKMGHIAKNCPARREECNKINKRHHAHTVEDEEPPTKMIKEKIEDYVLFYALLGSVSPREDTWLINSGASKYMKGHKDILSSLIEKEFPKKISLGDDY